MKWLVIAVVLAAGFVVIRVGINAAGLDARRGHPCLRGALLSDPGAAAPIASEGIPALNSAVRARLNNPRSFYPVGVQLHPVGQEVAGYRPAPNRSLAALRYRAENVFGATITQTVVAEIDPRNCTVVRIYD